MKARTLFITVLYTIIFHVGYSQNTSTLNGYKYVVVPRQFEFTRMDNEYGLNTTTRQLLENKGFVVFWTDEKLPMGQIGNGCNVLKVEVTQRKAMFTTNLTLMLKDCQGNVVFKGKEGKSREKEFPIAYDEALRNAFASLNDFAYHYDSTVLAAAPVQAAPVPAVPVSGGPAPVPAVVGIAGTLYAQATQNGYQLVDTTPKKVLTLLKTSLPDTYIAEGGVVFKKDGQWIYDHYENDKLVSQKLEIKF
jgi:hypothetical protein